MKRSLFKQKLQQQYKHILYLRCCPIKCCQRFTGSVYNLQLIQDRQNQNQTVKSVLEMRKLSTCVIYTHLKDY